MSLKYEPASEPLRLDARLAALGSFVCRRVQHPDVRTMPFDISRQLVGVALLGDLWNLKRRNRMMPFDISRRGVQMPQPYTLNPTPYTQHPTPYTLHPTP